MQVVFKDGFKVPVKMWNDTVPMETGVYEQTGNLARLPFIFKHVAVMPDAHVGKGSTVGSVIPTIKALIPAAVGVDIGCGMIATRLSIKADQLPDNLKPLYDQICRDLPVGQASHDKSQVGHPSSIGLKIDVLFGKYPKLFDYIGRQSDWTKQLGTLGGGNHFVEICIDESNDVWLMVHSGSRNLGNAIGRMFIDMARLEMQRHFINLPDKDLSYLVEGSVHYDAYVEAVLVAQEYAALNRKMMMDICLKAMSKYLPAFTLTQEAVNCHHNYISMENHYGENVWITRKGAIRVRNGELGIIPGSMGTKSYIVRGKGNQESFCSCSHGAGRVYSRGKAKELISLEDHIKATEGIMCRKDEGVIDESPAAYKNIDNVMESQLDLVDTIHTLKQVLCIKG